jgi:hypothetical protein
MLTTDNSVAVFLLLFVFFLGVDITVGDSATDEIGDGGLAAELSSSEELDIWMWSLYNNQSVRGHATISNRIHTTTYVKIEVVADLDRSCLDPCS